MKSIILVNKENEDPLWPIFHSYYSQHVDVIEPIWLKNTHTAYSPKAFSIEINKRQTELLSHYDVVLYADMDEFLIPDPLKYKDLRDYIEQKWDKLPRATGYHLVHNGEPEIDLEKPLLEQRGWWSLDVEGLYHKRLITHVPVGWTPGFHHFKGHPNPIPPDPDLILLHVIYCDAELALLRRRETFPNRSMTQVLKNIERFELTAVPERFKVL